MAFLRRGLLSSGGSAPTSPGSHRPPSCPPRVARGLRFALSSRCDPPLKFGASIRFDLRSSLHQSARASFSVRAAATFAAGPLGPDLSVVGDLGAFEKLNRGCLRGCKCLLFIYCLPFDFASNTFLFCHQGFKIFIRLNLSGTSRLPSKEISLVELGCQRQNPECILQEKGCCHRPAPCRQRTLRSGCRLSVQFTDDRPQVVTSMRDTASGGEGDTPHRSRFRFPSRTDSVWKRLAFLRPSAARG